jgi:2-polyprenyl-6-methoxyphenol hydroxylase-like FAD-dependent oxidoreductase
MTTRKSITQVLIVGAGPTGLTLACDLARRGIGVRIVDKARQHFTGSRGKALSPRTLEVLDDLGVAQRIMEAGLLNQPMRTYDGHRVISEVIVNPEAPQSDAVPYRGAVLIPQWRTESILRDQLARYHVTVELDHEVLALEQRDDHINITVSRDGTTTDLRADYVVGCDGGRSTMRHLTGMAFNGGPDESAKYAYVGDVKIEGLIPNVAHRWNDPERGMLLLTPFKDTDLWQFQFLPADRAAPLPEPSLEVFLQIWRDFAGLPDVRLLEARTASRFRVNEHIADHYRAGRAFLAGDAAHVYSPAGGQGMTTGIQDAYNLGWKMAAVLAGAPVSLLDSYEGERRPVAQHALTRSSQRWQQVNEAVATGTDPDLWGLVVNEDTSQLGITYRGGPLAATDAAGTATLHVGDRAPDGGVHDLDTGNEVRLFDLFRGPHWTVLTVGENSTAAMPSDYFGEPFHCHRVDGLPGYGISGDEAVVVRPDGYIAQIAAAQQLTGGGLLPAMTIAAPDTAAR